MPGRQRGCDVWTRTGVVDSSGEISDADPAQTRRSHPAWEWTRARWWEGSAARTYLRDRRCRTVDFRGKVFSLFSFRTRIPAQAGYRVFSTLRGINLTK